MLSKRQADAYRARIRNGERVTLRAHVRARMLPASYDVVNATIAGSDANAGEVVLTAHLCHQSAGANDNASGTAALIELARTYAPTSGPGRIKLPYTLLFLSTDGAGDGALGAAEFVANSRGHFAAKGSKLRTSMRA